MATTTKTAEERICRLVTQANIDYNETVVPWDYELTSEVDNLSVVVTASAKTLKLTRAGCASSSDATISGPPWPTRSLRGI
jgi:hypothetical protein